jgi:hypothetical protein
MTDPKALRLFQEVLDKTKADRIRWEPTAKENEFFSVLPSGNVLAVSLWDERNSWGDPTGTDAVLTLAADNQELLLRVTPGVEGIGISQMIELYELARRRALHVNDRVDEVLGDLARL